MVKTMPTEQVLPMRTKGRIIYESKPKPVVSGAEPSQKQQQNQTRARGTIVKGDRPLPPNWKCYPEAFKGRIDDKGSWLPCVSRRLPKCRVCDGTLHKNENHECEGFKPKFVERDEAWQQKQDAKRAEIRESNYSRPIKCAACHKVIHDQDDACWHEEHCHADSPRGRHWYTDLDPIVGDNDGHECYEDYVEPDYCEGSDDGYDCD
jgi:hypothetical protein